MPDEAPARPVIDHPHADQQKKFRVGYWVLVEVDAHEGEAHLVGERACGWPGDYSPPAEPIPVEGEINGFRVTARIIRSKPLMVTPIDE